MVVWFDFGHIPQYNFCKSIIRKLAGKNHTIYITAINRGRMLDIIKSEVADLDNVFVFPIGTHGMSKWSAIWNANVLRIIKMIIWAHRKNIDCAISSTLPCAFVAWIYNITMFAYTDDTDRWTYKNIVRFCTSETNLIVPPVGGLAQKKTTVLNALKEWAYLSPKEFFPNQRVLYKYGLKPKQYLFLREVTVGTANYTGQHYGAVLDVKDIIDSVNWLDSVRQKHKMKILLSLEKKDTSNLYPKDWILLHEPVEDIHSLIYYSAGLVSSGDSMAREAALLGVPSYYLGIRHSMPANEVASKVANLHNQHTMQFDDWAKSLDEDAAVAIDKQNKLRQKVDFEFVDINEYMISLVESVEKSKKSCKS